MPIYVYHCSTCQETREVQQSIKEPTIDVCPQCGGSQRRIIQPVGIAFVGSGFHANDYGKNGRNSTSYRDYKGT